MTTYYRLDGLNKKLISQFWRLKRPRSKCRQGFLRPHLFFVRCWGESKFFGAFSYKGANPIMRAALSWPHLTLITSRRSHLQISLHWDVGLQSTNFRGVGVGKHLVLNTEPWYVRWTYRRSVKSNRPELVRVPQLYYLGKLLNLSSPIFWPTKRGIKLVWSGVLEIKWNDWSQDV